MSDEKKTMDAASGNIPLPQVTFSTFVMSLASSALVPLGEVPDPETGKPTENLALAKHSIDVLSMLEEKTKGNLDDEERQLITDLLYDLRMKYVLKTR
ncbi:DUF1844 domain-containing protein [Desulfobaculum sp.]|jgi:hypothetical protein